ncbi:MAG: hypothetical protein ISF22_07330 [Methanomassiliicoccus sp.]|nr:hypothetical protein [Methanomassiliicoccus sp.]
MGSSQRKVPGGKLLRVRLRIDGGTVVGAEISGDFFLHPEESISVLEGVLVGMPTDVSESDLASAIEAALRNEGIVVIGFGPQDLAAVAREAMR